MIQRNPVVRSLVTVFLFWYAALFVVAGFQGYPIYLVAYYLAIATAVILVGGALGSVATLGLRGLFGQVTETTIREGGSFRDARIALGRMPPLPQAKRAKLPPGFFDQYPWWPVVQEKFPQHAAAIRAVLEVMQTRPSLPASPIPGGHGGRTLLQHSIAVGTEIIAQAKTWVYDGQRDKRGRVRVRVEGQPHRFDATDAGLLLLAGIAHDIGKITCFEEAGKDSTGRPRIREVHGNHDTEGARILRSLPEVMALPFADRMALLLAVGHYHHPWAMPKGAWLTDRMRSLTELLIRADVETGRKEGHVLSPSRDHEEEEFEDARPGEVSETPLEDDEDDEDATVGAGMIAQLEGAKSQRRSAPRVAQGDDEAFAMAPAKPRATDRSSERAVPPARPSATDEQYPLELDLALQVLGRDGAINGRDKGRRVAWKHGDRIYVMDAPFRRIVGQFGRLPPQALIELGTPTGNVSPFVGRLLEQLDARGWLVRNFDGKTYVPSRAVFYAVSEGGEAEIPVFIVKTAAVPASKQINCGRPMRVIRSLWDPDTARNPKGMVETDGAASNAQISDSAPRQAQQASHAPATAAAAVTSDDDWYAPETADDSTTASAATADEEETDGAARQATPAAPPADTRETASATDEPGPAKRPVLDENEEMAKKLPVVFMVALRQANLMDEVEVQPLDGGITRYTVMVRSEAGQLVSGLLTRYEAAGISSAFVRRGRRGSDKALVYSWEIAEPSSNNAAAA